MREVTVSLGEDARVGFETKLNGVSVDATALPAVEGVWVNGAFDAALQGSAAVTQLQDGTATNIDGLYEVVLDVDALTIADQLIVKVSATPTGGVEVSQSISVRFVDPAAAAASVSSID